MTDEIHRTLQPGEAIGFTVEAGWHLRLSQVEGGQVADLVSFASDDPDDRLGMYMSRAVNRTWKLTAPHVLVSTDGRDLWTIVEDTLGDNYSGGGFCNPWVNERRSGRGDAANCEDNLVSAVAPFGLARRSFDADTCLNIFMGVEYPTDGSWVIVEPRCGPDDFIVLRAERAQIVALSNCPQLLNAANGYRLKSLRLDVEPGPATAQKGDSR